MAVQASGRAAAQQLLPEVLAEAFAHQVQGERVHAGVGEGQDPSAHAGDEVGQRRVHLAVVVGAVKVEDVAGQPADGEQADKHQHGFGQTLTRLDLTNGKTRSSIFPSLFHFFDLLPENTLKYP